MPTLRTNISNSSSRNRVSYVSGISNIDRKQPRMRGSFPKPVKWSIGDEGITNKRLDYNRAINLNKTAQKISVKNSYSANKKYSATNYSKSIYDGNAARKLNYTAAPKTYSQPAQKKQEKQRNLQSIKGAQAPRGVMQGAVLSPMIVNLAKIAAIVVCFLAVIAFIRVGLTAATASKGIESKEIATQINNEQIRKNALEVQNSTLSNSGRIKQAAADYKLVPPPTMTTITLPPDVLAYNGDQVSLVESLNRLSALSQ